MEIIGYGLICALFSFIGYQWGGNWDPIFNNLFSIFFRDTVQKILKLILPYSIPYYFKARKNKKQMLEEIVAYIESLSPEEKKELENFSLEFIKQCKFCKNLTFKIGDDETISLVELLFDAGPSMARYSKKSELYAELSEASKKLLKGLSKCLRGIEKKQKNKLPLLDVEQVSEELFKKINMKGPFPEPVKNIIGIINYHMFELTYLHLSRESKDMVKVLEYLEAQREDKIRSQFSDEIKPVLDYMERMLGRMGGMPPELKALAGEYTQTLDLIGSDKSPSEISDILSQNHVLTDAPSVVNINAMAKKDPFCYIRLECPNCGASGEYITRIDNNVSCGKCHGYYDIVRAIDEDEITKLVKQSHTQLCQKFDIGTQAIGSRISAAQRTLQADITAAHGAVLTEITDAKQQIFDELEAIAGKVVSFEYFNAKCEALAGNQNENAARLDVKVGKGFKQLEDAVNNRLDRVIKTLEAANLNNQQTVLRQNHENQQSYLRVLNEQRDLISGVAHKLDGLTKTVFRNLCDLHEKTNEIHQTTGRIDENLQDLIERHDAMFDEILSISENTQRIGQTTARIESKLYDVADMVRAAGKDARENSGTIVKLLKKMLEDMEGRGNRADDMNATCPCCQSYECFTSVNLGEAAHAVVYRCPRCNYQVDYDRLRSNDRHATDIYCYQLQRDGESTQSILLTHRPQGQGVCQIGRLDLNNTTITSISRGSMGIEGWKDVHILVLTNEHPISVTEGALNLLYRCFPKVTSVIGGDNVTFVASDIPSPLWKISNKNTHIIEKA